MGGLLLGILFHSHQGKLVKSIGHILSECLTFFFFFFNRTGFQILGRNSIDIIKSSGAKISALEIERVLLDHPLIDEVAVVGVEEEERGECVVAVVTLLSPSSPSLPLVEADEEVFESVKREGRKGLAAYKLPRRVFVWKDGALPKNPVGKVNKKEIKKMVTKIMQENSK